MARNDQDRPQSDIREASRRETGDEGYRCELCGAWIEYCDLGKVLAHERDRILRKSCEATMIIDKPEREVDGWDEAEAALTAAQQMPEGPERVAALKKAGQLRFRADERRRAIRDQERVSKLELDRLIKAQHLLQSSFY
jgi:hypothetical protein